MPRPSPHPLRFHPGWLLCLVLSGLTPAVAEEIRCASAESMGGLMSAWTRDYSARHPESPAQVTREARFSGEFTEPLARGEIQVAPFAREMFPAELERCRQLAGGEPRLFPVAGGSRATRGGTHAIVIFVNARNPLSRLTLPQLRRIFSADQTSATWGEVGLAGEWSARPIHVHGMRARRPGGNPPGIVNFLEQRLLGGARWRSDLIEHDDVPGGAQALETIVRAVAEDEEAIGYSGFVYAQPGVKPLALGATEVGPFLSATPAQVAGQSYPLARTIYLATGPHPAPAVMRFIDYVRSPEGQAWVARDAQGFFPLPGTMAPEPMPVETVPPPAPDAPYRTADGAITLVGYNDMAELIEGFDRLFTAAHPGFRFAPVLKGTKTAVPALLAGKSALAPMGAEFSQEELASFRAATGSDPLVFRVAHASLDARALSGPLAIVVPRASPLRAISLPELTEIFSGRQTQGLHPCGLKAETALGRFFLSQILPKDRFPGEFRGYAQSAEVVEAVARDPQAIGFAAAMRADARVRVLPLSRTAGAAPVTLTAGNLQAGLYPLDRHLLIAARAPLEPWMAAYLRLTLSPAGQAVVAASALGYLPLGPDELQAEREKLAAADRATAGGKP